MDTKPNLDESIDADGDDVTSGLIDGLQHQLADFQKLLAISEMQHKIISEKDFDDHVRLGKILMARQTLIEQILLRDDKISASLKKHKSENKSAQDLLVEIARLRDEVMKRDRLDEQQIQTISKRLKSKLKDVNGGQQVRRTYQKMQNLSQFNQLSNDPSRSQFTDQKV